MFVDWMGAFVAPLRAWPGGADGKYIHFLIGAISALVLTGFILMTNPVGFNFIGISLFGLVVGITIERIQKLFGGTNTTKEMVFDALWVQVGASAVAYALLVNGIIIPYYVF